MSRLATRVADTASTGAAKAQCRAVGLNMAYTLTMVTLLAYGKNGSVTESGHVVEYHRADGSLPSVVRGCGQPLDSWPCARLVFRTGAVLLHVQAVEEMMRTRLLACVERRQHGSPGCGDSRGVVR